MSDGPLDLRFGVGEETADTCVKKAPVENDRRLKQTENDYFRRLFFLERIASTAAQAGQSQYLAPAAFIS